MLSVSSLSSLPYFSLSEYSKHLICSFAHEHAIVLRFETKHKDMFQIMFSPKLLVLQMVSNDNQNDSNVDTQNN